MGCVIAVAAVLIVIGLKKDKPADVPDVDEPAGIVDTATPTEPVEAPPAIPVIDVFGEVVEYDSVYCVGNTG